MILFFGPAGAGKSVQGQLLATRNGWQWISTGNIFRQTGDAEVQEILKSGGLISDEMTCRVVDDAFEKLEDEAFVVLDGFPRTPEQAKWLMSDEFKADQTPKMAIVLEVPDKEIISRLMLRGRNDDTPDKIKKRMGIYRNAMYPMLSELAKSNVNIVHVDGVGTVGEVHDRIQATIEACQLV